MKKKIVIILSIFISILIGCSEDSKGSDANYLNDEIQTMKIAFDRCNIDQDIQGEFILTTEGYFMPNYQKGNYDNFILCINNIENLSCEDVEKIKTVTDLESIEGCLDFDYIDKITACGRNYVSFCWKIEKNCGKDYFSGIYCDQLYSEWGSSESPESGYDYDKAEDYCQNIEDGDQQIDSKYDLFSFHCENYTIDCDNIKVIDFTNSEWKDSCVEE